jgi:hypothetical protein
MTNAALITSAAALAVLVACGIAAAFYFMKRAKAGDGPVLFSARLRRLGYVERIGLDGGRRLLLIRRDNVEHLVMVGGPIDVVIETGIKAAPGVALRDAEYPSASAKVDQRDLNIAAFSPLSASRSEAASHTRHEEPFELSPLSEVKAVR